MYNHNGYFKENGKFFVLNGNGKIIEVSAVKIAQLEMMRKGNS